MAERISGPGLSGSRRIEWKKEGESMEKQGLGRTVGKVEEEGVA